MQTQTAKWIIVLSIIVGVSSFTDVASRILEFRPIDGGVISRAANENPERTIFARDLKSNMENVAYIYSKSCKLQVKTSKNGCVIKTALAGKCNAPLTVTDEMTRQVSSTWKKAAHSFIVKEINPSGLTFSSSNYNKCNKVMKIVAKTNDALILESRKLTLQQGATVTLEIDLNNPGDYKSIGFIITATMKIRNMVISLTVSKLIGQEFGKITGTAAGQIKFEKLLMYFGYQARQIVNVGIIEMPKVKNFIFRNPSITGCVSEKDGVQFGLSTTSSEKSVFKSAEILFGIHVNKVGKDLPLLIALINPAIQPPLMLLKGILKKAASKKVSVPMLSTTRKKYAFILCKHSFNVNFGKNITGLDVSESLVKDKLIKAGARLITALQIREYFKKCSPKKEFTEIPESVIAFAEIKGISIQMEYKEKVNVQIGDLLLCLTPEERQNIPSEIFKGGNKGIELRSYSYNPLIKAWKILIALPFPLNITEDFIVKEMFVQISKEKKEKPVKYEATGMMELFGKSLQAAVTKEEQEYTLSVFLESLNLTQAKEKLYKNVTNKLIDFKSAVLQNVKFEITIGDNPTGRVMASLALKKVSMGFEAFTFLKNDNSRSFALGIFAKNVPLRELLIKSGALKETSGFDWFEDTSVIMSLYKENVGAKKKKKKEGEEGEEEKEKEKEEKEKETEGKEEDKDKEKEDKEKSEKEKEGEEEEKKEGEGEGEEEEEEEEEEDDYSYETPGLSGLPFIEGLYVKILMKVPSNCKSSIMCKIVKETMGEGAEITIQAQIDSSGIQLNGTGPTVQNLTSNLYLEEATLIMDMRSKFRSTQGILMTLKTRSPVLKFSGSILAKACGGVELSLTMVGMWKKPFGVEWLAVGNLLLKIDFQFGKGFPRLEFGGEVWLGKIGNNKEIKIRCYVGYNPSNSKDNYVFASINKLTLHAISEAFELDIKASKAVRNSGFPEGLVVSYTQIDGGVSLPDFDITIEQGFYLKGKLSIMDFNVSATIQINLPDIFIEAEMTPVNLANGLIEIRRGKDNKKEGPYMYVRISEFNVQVRIEGYASLLGSAKAIVLHISNQGFKLFYYEKIFGFIETNVTVQANWGLLRDANFMVEACASLSLQKIGEKIIEILGKFSKMASEAIDKASAKVEKARAAFQRAQAKVNEWKGGIARYRGRLEARKRELDRKKRELQYSCKNRCGTVCIPFFGWNSRCWRCLWWWCGCPTWNPCRWRVPDLICLAGCELKKLGNQIAIWAERLGINILIGLTRVADFALSAANAVIGLASHVIDIAKAVLAFVKAAVQFGTFIAQQIVKFATNAFVLEYLCLRAEIKIASGACFELALKCKIFGEPLEYHGRACIGSDSKKKLAEDAVKKKYPESQQMQQKVSQSEQKMGDVDRKQNELKNKEEGAQREVNKLNRRYHVYRLRDNQKLRDEFEEDTEQYSTRNEYMRKVFRESAMWNLEEDDKNSYGKGVPLQEGDVEGRKEVPKPCSGTSDCEKMHNVAGKYSFLKDGLNLLTKTLKEQKESYTSTKSGFEFSVRSLERRANMIEKNNQLSEEEKQDLYYLVKKMKEGAKKYAKKNDPLLKKYQKIGTKNFKDQINFVLKSNTGKDINSYLQEVKDCSQQVVKRSSIKSNFDYQQQISQIHDGAVALFSSMENDDYDLAGEVNRWSDLVDGLKSSLGPCQ